MHLFHIQIYIIFKEEEGKKKLFIEIKLQEEEKINVHTAHH